MARACSVFSFAMTVRLLISYREFMGPISLNAWPKSSATSSGGGAYDIMGFAILLPKERKELVKRRDLNLNLKKEKCSSRERKRKRKCKRGLSPQTLESRS